MKRITVFCGSSFGNEKNYEIQAFKLGQIMAENNYELVYGGAKVGLMGSVADGVLNHNGKVFVKESGIDKGTTFRIVLRGGETT